MDEAEEVGLDLTQDASTRGVSTPGHRDGTREKEVNTPAFMNQRMGLPPLEHL